MEANSWIMFAGMASNITNVNGIDKAKRHNEPPHPLHSCKLVCPPLAGHLTGTKRSR